MDNRLRRARIVAALGVFIATGPTVVADSEPELHIHVFGQPGIVVGEIVRGAIHRLERPECAQIIGELNDDLGRPLAWNLSERNMNPDVYLATLRFLDGDNLEQCMREGIVAMTMPNSRVVWVCGRRFARHFALNHPLGEAIIIHELLHSLGLQENPPTSAEITEIVAQRCGD